MQMPVTYLTNIIKNKLIKLFLAPHLGHLYSSLIADTISRFEHLTSFHRNNIFSTGTDEHGMKVLQSAEKNNASIENYCKSISNQYKGLFKESGIEYTNFIRTTDDQHKIAVTALWNKLKSQNAIYKDKYSGYYCLQDETFLSDSQLSTDPVTGKKTSIESGHPVEWSEEENYMFKLTDYQEDVIYWAKHENRVVPNKFNKILLDMLHHESLPDLSISRPSSRMTWGIPVPDDSSQNIYVWLDALTNYLTVSGYPNEMKIWPPNVQVIGKDILKFHGIYWPAFLIAANLEPPEQLLVHSHWTVDGQKMSKSKGNVIDPMERSKIYSFEGIRYFLLREGVQHSDGNYSDEKIIKILNAELANTFGNLFSRACANSLNPEQKIPKIDPEQMNELIKNESCKILFEKLTELPDVARKFYSEYSFHLVVDSVMSTLHAANGFFESAKPWEFKNSKEQADKAKLDTIISITLECLRICGIVMQPIVPNYSCKLLERLNVSKELRFWKNTKLNLPKTTRPLVNLNSNVLFQKIIIADEKDKKEKVRLNKKRVN